MFINITAYIHSVFTSLACLMLFRQLANVNKNRVFVYVYIVLRLKGTYL